MKRGVNKLYTLLFLWITFIFWSLYGNISFLNETTQKLEDENTERFFEISHSIWPQLAGKKVSTFVDEERPRFRPWLDLDKNCGSFETYFAKNGTFQPPVYLTSYPGKVFIFVAII